MSGGIFLLTDSGEVVDMRQQPFKSEEFFQHLIAEHPELLAGDQYNGSAPRQFLLISPEMGLPSEEDGSNRWAIDHLFVDQDAILTVVEVKRSTDTRIRREVVGQMLDYAANAVVYLPVEKLRATFEKHNQAPEQRFHEIIGEEADYEVFWEQVRTNLQAGKIRLLFVADDIPPELRRIVEFLNKSMPNVEVLAIEVKQYTDSGEKLRTLVPRVIGQTAESQRNKSVANSGTKEWDEKSFLTALALVGEEEVAVAKKILDWAKGSVTRVEFRKGLQDGSFTPILDYKGKMSLFYVRERGQIELPFCTSTYRKPPFDLEDKRRELITRLKGINGIELDDDIDIDHKAPKFSLRLLANENSLGRFLDTYDWFVAEIRNAN